MLRIYRVTLQKTITISLQVQNITRHIKYFLEKLFHVPHNNEKLSLVTTTSAWEITNGSIYCLQTWLYYISWPKHLTSFNFTFQGKARTTSKLLCELGIYRYSNKFELIQFLKKQLSKNKSLLHWMLFSNIRSIIALIKYSITFLNTAIVIHRILFLLVMEQFLQRNHINLLLLLF